MGDVDLNKRGSDTNVKIQYLRVEVLTALWALTEAALGGVLHAIHVPFTGLFVNSCAVLYMVMIATASEKKGAVLKATLIVMIIKGMVSPHTPINAFIAVGFQGAMGEILLRSKKYLFPSSVFLGTITLLQSALQKIVILTIVYGYNLWQTIDVFVNFIIGQMPFLNIQNNPIEFSFWLISIYVGTHLIAGILIGIVAAKIPGWINREIDQKNMKIQLEEGNYQFDLVSKKKKKKWVQKPSAVAITILASIIIIFSYLYPEISETQGMRAVVMILRSTAILFLWYTLIGPYLLKLSHRYLKNKQSKYTAEVQKTLNILIPLRYIIYKTWNESRKLQGVKRLKYFIKLSLINILSTEFYADEDN